MNFELNQPLYAVYCNRDIIFKKYNRQISELIRLDINIDLFPKKKGALFCDENNNKSTDIYYIDMSSTEFIVYNEDLKKCGHYDYNEENIIYYKLPLNNKVTLFKKSCEDLKECNESDKIKTPHTEKVTVRRIQIEGKTFLISRTNIIYDINTKEEVGIWDPINNYIKEHQKDEDYDSDEENNEDDDSLELGLSFKMENNKTRELKSVF